MNTSDVKINTDLLDKSLTQSERFFRVLYYVKFEEELHWATQDLSALSIVDAASKFYNQPNIKKTIFTVTVDSIRAVI